MLTSVIQLETPILLIELISTAIIAGYVIAALVTLALTHSIPAARLLVAEGALYGLSFEVAATLLRTIALHTWQEIGIFAVILAIRTAIKLVFSWEQGHIRLLSRWKATA